MCETYRLYAETSFSKGIQEHISTKNELSFPGNKVSVAYTNTEKAR